MERGFDKIITNDERMNDTYGFYFILYNNIKYGYIGEHNNPVLYVEMEDIKYLKTSFKKRTRGLSMGCEWSNWNTCYV